MKTDNSLRDLWREVSRGEKVLAAGLALIVAGFALTGAGFVLEVAPGFRAGPHLLLTGGGLVFAGAFTLGAAGAINEHDERRLRRERLEREEAGR